MLTSLFSIGGFAYMWYFLNVLGPNPTPTSPELTLAYAPILDQEKAVPEQLKKVEESSKNAYPGLIPVSPEEIQMLAQNGQLIVPKTEYPVPQYQPPQFQVPVPQQEAPVQVAPTVIYP